MIIGDLLSKIGIRVDNCVIMTPFLRITVSQNQNNKTASWKMYIELITRISTQHLPDEQGAEKAALDSIYKLFGITREILKEHGREADTFSPLAICMLNIGLRPFTAKWHKIFNDDSITKEINAEFRKELRDLQLMMCKFTALFLHMSNVEHYDALDFEAVEAFAKELNIV